MGVQLAPLDQFAADRAVGQAVMGGKGGTLLMPVGPDQTAGALDLQEEDIGRTAPGEDLAGILALDLAAILVEHQLAATHLADDPAPGQGRIEAAQIDGDKIVGTAAQGLGETVSRLRTDMDEGFVIACHQTGLRLGTAFRIGSDDTDRCEHRLEDRLQRRRA